MCGIAAILLCPEDRTPEQWRAIKSAFTQNLIFNEERGRAATGVAIIDTSGGTKLRKSPLAASRFTRTAEYRDVLRNIGAGTTLILGHTRLPTKGDPSRNGNNHPIQAGSVIGVHNGNVINDDELFADCGCARTGEVDSEIIFRLIEGTNPDAFDDQYLWEVRQRLGRMQGQYTFLACDQRKPSQVLVLRHGNPLCIHFHREWHALIFSSRYVFLRKAFGQSLIADPLEHDRLMLFDATKINELESKPRRTLSLYV
jgi:amidophosphoribosyltransferase